MTVCRKFCFAVIVLAMPSVASAKTAVISIDSRSGPWSNAANPTMRYGVGDEAPPMVVRDFVNDVEEKVEIYPEPGATSMIDGKPVGSEGVSGDAADDRLGPKKRNFPSLYVPKMLYPTNRHALIAVFADAQGKLMGRPFPVGRGVRVTIPNGAATLNFGFNDVTFAKNSGALSVAVVLPD